MFWTASRQYIGFNCDTVVKSKLLLCSGKLCNLVWGYDETITPKIVTRTAMRIGKANQWTGNTTNKVNRQLLSRPYHRAHCGKIISTCQHQLDSRYNTTIENQPAPFLSRQRFCSNKSPNSSTLNATAFHFHTALHVVCPPLAEPTTHPSYNNSAALAGVRDENGQDPVAEQWLFRKLAYFEWTPNSIIIVS